MGLLFVEYPKCSTCQKAKAWLNAGGIVFEDRHIVLQPPTAAELEIWLQKSGMPLKKLWNTSGQKYRSLGLAEKLGQMDAAQQLALLASDGMLVKRPVLVGETFALFGFAPEAWRAALIKEKAAQA
ncbi:MAG: arsenate reductase family protein [Oscillospiraceae bacterium]|nr:arsenate reductase family protein [Oscillospiraceae bacterium]